MPTDAMLAADLEGGLAAVLIVAFILLAAHLTRADARAAAPRFTEPRLQHSRSWARECVRINRGRRIDAGVVLPMPIDPVHAELPLPELDGLAAFIVAPLLLTDAFRLPTVVR